MSNKLSALRQQMQTKGLQAYIVPYADEHQSEYLDNYAKRLAWLTNFTGSAGTAIVLPDRAAVFVDGRYTLQAAKQVDQKQFEIVYVAEETPWQWLTKHIQSNDKVGIDAWLHTEAEVQQLRNICNLIPLHENLVDAIWHDQPQPSTNSAFIYDLKYAGVSHQQKIKQITAEMQANHIVISALCSVCWLLNIRGSDVEDMPVVFAYVVVSADGAVNLFIDQQKLTPEVINHLGSSVVCHDKAAIVDFLSNLSQVQIDPKNTPYRLLEVLGECVRKQDPCALPSACKNAVEVQGVKAAHLRDGAALCNFLAWLELKSNVTELDVVDTLHKFRQEQDLFVSNSFATIAGSGPNGAIIHYRVDENSNRLLKKDAILLLDSGGQYYDGTTDITRVVAMQEPTAEQKDRFTRVLKGHIALAKAVFPQGTTGSQLDTLARAPLWQVGLDYAHGTGHGVGHFLGVHDGPQRIGKGVSVALQPGMVLSNEPGYYKEGEYGFRVESLMIVTEVVVPGAELPMLGFETLSMVPIEQELIDVPLLDKAELQWLNDYHEQVQKKLLALVNADTKDWLLRKTGVIKTINSV